MKNARNNGQKRVKNCLKWTASGLLLAVMFALVFAGTLSGAFGIEENLQQNGIIENNVASADGAVASTTIDLSNTFTNTASSININPDVSKKGRIWSTNADHTTNNTWTTGDATTGGQWYIGNNASHTGSDYACVWFVYDLGANYKDKVYGDMTVSITATYMAWDGAGIVAIESGDSLTAAPTDAGKAGNWYTNVRDSKLNTTSWESSGEMKKTKGGTAAVNLSLKVAGRYIRIHYATWDGSWDYNEQRLDGVKVTLTRDLAYKIEYNKNASDSTGTVSDTSHKYMADSNISSNFYVGNRQYFTEWNTSADGNGVRMAIGASTGTSTAANTFGSIVKTNLEANNTTTTLYAQYVGISFVFNRQSYSIYNNEVLQVLQGKSGYLTHTVDSSYTTTITYKNSSNSTIPEPTSIGVYSATITVTKDGKTRGSVTLPFEIIEGDFGKIQGGTGKWGSVTNPYVISNETHLKNLSAIVNGRDALNSIVGSDGVTAEQVVATDKTYKDCYFVVAADLGADTPIALVSIGKDNTHYFAGTIFGGNDSDATNRTQRTIYLNVSQSGVDNVGLFGYVKGATISHLTTAGTIVGGAAVGGLVGYADGVTISNCRNNASISGKSFIGGIVGKATNATINASHNTNTIQGSSTNVGGILGGSDTADNNILITSCYNTAKISGIDNVGGITGRFAKNGDKDVKISNCYNLGEVFGTADSIGGIVGFSENGCVVEYCYNKAKITGSYALGGIVGSIRNGGSISILYCYADFTDEQKQLNATNPNSATGGVAGGIVSGCFAGTNTANITVENSWAIYNYSSVKYTDCKKQFDCITDFAVAPLFF